MILFGRKDKLLATREIPSEVCEECGKRGGIVSVFQLYYHILLVPMIPLTRKAASQCYSCRKVKVQKYFSPQQKEVTDLLKKEAKTPLWTLIGVSIIFLGVMLSLVLR